MCAFISDISLRFNDPVGQIMNSRIADVLTLRGQGHAEE